MVSPALSDEALLSGLAAGDADAATAFTRRFQARVYGLVLTIVRDEGTAEDVAQETFVRAWRHAQTYDPRRGRVATWLLTIARNLAIDVVRVKRAEPLDPDIVLTKLQRAGLSERPVDQAFPPDERDRVRGAIVAAAARPAPRARTRRLPRADRQGDRRAGGHPARHGKDPHTQRDARAAIVAGDVR